jgi:predicted helicase
VVIGNPPYNANQLNENDNNKNREYKKLELEISHTYAHDSRATNLNKLNDPYVKFIRWATDRLQERDGIVCFVTNNSFVDQIAFDGMRKHLLEDFDTVYHLDLHGNVYKNPKLSGTTHNVFGIKVGVGITVAVKRSKQKRKRLLYHRVPEFWQKEEKYRFLNESKAVSDVSWQMLTPDKHNNWLGLENVEEFEQFIPLGTKEAKSGKAGGSQAVFKLYSNGVKTNRDEQVYSFTPEDMEKNVKKLIRQYNSEVHRYAEYLKDLHERNQELSKKQAAPEPEIPLDDFVDYSEIDWSEGLKGHLSRGTTFKYDRDNVRKALYRPHEKLLLYFGRDLNERAYRFLEILPKAETENLVICLSGVGSSKPFQSLMTDLLPGVDTLEKTQCFPFYVYKEDGTGRRENVTDWAVERFKEKYEIRNEKTEERKRDSGRVAKTDPARRKEAPREREEIQKWDVFYYVYGILHHPGYREKFGDNLKRELPRIPFAPDFWAFSEAGRKLAELHLKYEERKPVWEETPPCPPAKAGGKRKPDSGHAGTHASAEKNACRLVIDPKAKTRDLYRVEKMRLSKDKHELKVNDSITVTGIPSEVYDYRLGNRSALEWVVDQYQIKTDKRSGITHDPNREDDPQYIVRLVGQVIRVSLETVQMVRDLPAEFC